MYKAPTICPVCYGKMNIEVLRCSNCNSKLEGNFEMNEFASLSNENVEFLRLYLLNRGNLSKVSEILKVSYPTVLNKFNKLLQDLGYSSNDEIQNKTEEEIISSEKKKILDDLEKGLLKPKEAVEKLKSLRG
ncbi:hypothetical protein SAMN02745164_01096 [Marinitoga hydrogenitolerans DSM 16785]|uniref:DUF2089 domain-containing protein n=1 Tax=Marinitoga hydrogenitolerans (strain DSM 16785 / JCM 12826 / AT1271) TaxID=1122195 RepID=A0A1M4W5J8_MARH1|nr:DUF2089 domain-containing protein [Marinitoga hydrogenitolerans]SHE76487.1 hypothetical protein SAMN02745164_01096 [Marinitoga hydrogenitolerans DSM 16785]